jgi:predicted nucleic acid-binding protein
VVSTVPVATAKIAYVEVHAGLARKRREAALSVREHARAASQFDRDWPAYVRVDLTDEVLATARDLIQRHPLCGFDAVHLASALAMRQALGEALQFGAADERLLRAAAAEGLESLDVEAVP